MYNSPSNTIRSTLRMTGVVLYRLGLAKKIIGLRKNSVRVLLYHAVEDHVSPYTDRLGVSVSPAMFEANLSYIRDNYNVISVDDLQKPLPENPLLITFDDGYKSVYEHAFPLLRKYRMPAVVYLITCAVENKLVWVNELNWALLTHPKEAFEICQQFPDLYNLINCDKNELQRQLDSSGINDVIDQRTFAYPFGSFDRAAIDELGSKNYQSVMTVGNNNERFSSYHVDRIEVFSVDPAVVFARTEIEEPIIGAIRKLSLNMAVSAVHHQFPQYVPFWRRIAGAEY